MDKQKIIVIAIVLTVFSVCVAAFLTGGFGLYDRYLRSRSSDAENNPNGGSITESTGENSEEPSESTSRKDDPSTTETEQVTETIPTTVATPEPGPFEGLKARAVYYTGSSAGSSAKIDEIIDMASRTELNAVVIDVKDTWVNYNSEIPEVNEHNLSRNVFDPEHVLERLHDNNIYVIARIVVYKDHQLATKRADLAVKTNSGGIYYENGVAWTNPYNREVWEYNIEVAREAAIKGFDEIQFDYVRFPAGTRDVNYGEDPPTKAEAVNGFLKMAMEELEPLGVKVSADIFGIVIESDLDGRNIGQEFDKVGMDIDYICPMIYPSHYANSSNGIMGNGYGQEIGGVLFTKPDFEPYKLVYLTLLNAKNKLAEIDGYKAGIRPYIQAFTASYLEEGYYQKYGAEQIRQQVQGVYDAGYEEWILWNPGNTYPEGAFLPK